MIAPLYIKNKYGDTKEINCLYNVWYSMKYRCSPNANGNARKNYYSKGIRVCQEWQDFEKFYLWAIKNGFKYEPSVNENNKVKNKISIDRIDPDGNYEPSNCRFVDDYRIQARNTSWRKHNLICPTAGHSGPIKDPIKEAQRAKEIKQFRLYWQKMAVINLRYLRIKNELSIEELSLLTNIAKERISLFEENKEIVSKKELNILSRTFNIPKNWLFDETEYLESSIKKSRARIIPGMINKNQLGRR